MTNSSGMTVTTLSVGGAGHNNFVGGAGNDLLVGGDDDDTVYFNIDADGVDFFDPGGVARGINTVISTGGPATGIRLAFSSTEVGNGTNYTSPSFGFEGIHLAVQYQRSFTDVASSSLFGDERVIFRKCSGANLFRVRIEFRDTYRRFSIVVLGFDEVSAAALTGATDQSYYIVGPPIETLTGRNLNDVLVGQTGDDTLRGNEGSD